ncbi:MAG: bacillithiol biosynthesis cysteine-adding enzyme BshC [Bryobacteraceae bacterium]
MECSCVHQTLIPGTTKLFADYLYQFERVRRFYPSHFTDAEKLAASAKQVDFPEQRRALLVAALREQNGDSPVLAKLAEPGTVAVVTGQQVGLFSGPAYTIFKALTAVKLAQHLTDQGVPAVPIFWLATEDHDLAEVDHAWVFNHAGIPTKLSISETAATGGPVGEVRPEHVPFEELREALGNLPFADEVAARVELAYRPDATMGSAFGAFLHELLKDCGLLYLDPLAPAVREIATPFINQAVHRVPDLLRALRERNRELEAAGYHAQVHIDDSTSLVFLIDESKRVPLRWKNGRFSARDKSYTPGDLALLDGRLSPNALLRPVMEDYLLPTAAYVGGPSEVAYMAQAQVLYKALLGRMPVIFPRNSFTLLDSRATKLLERYDLRVPDLLSAREKVTSRIAARLVPGRLTDEFAGVRSAVSSSLASLQSNLCAFDPTLDAAAKKSTAKILYQIDKLSRKAAREAMLRDERAKQDATYLMNLVFPHRHLQERFYSIIPFLAQHGLDLPQRLMHEVQLGCPDHMIRAM